MRDRRAELQWRNGRVPVSARFNDPYFSLENGLAETRHVFLRGNALPERFVPGFHIAELGFGSGLNFLATLQIWRASGCGGRLNYTSFEAFPMVVADMSRALAGFPELAGLRSELTEGWTLTGNSRVFGGNVTLTLVTGDARQTLPRWQGRADAWFLDGFSPAKNPELWQPNLMTELARHTAPGGTAATYTAAGFVRRGLAAAGFSVSRAPGFGRKRHMTRAVLR